MSNALDEICDALYKADQQRGKNSCYSIYVSPEVEREIKNLGCVLPDKDGARYHRIIPHHNAGSGWIIVDDDDPKMPVVARSFSAADLAYCRLHGPYNFECKRCRAADYYLGQAVPIPPKPIALRDTWSLRLETPTGKVEPVCDLASIKGGVMELSATDQQALYQWMHDTLNLRIYK